MQINDLAPEVSLNNDILQSILATSRDKLIVCILMASRKRVLQQKLVIPIAAFNSLECAFSMESMYLRGTLMDGKP